MDSKRKILFIVNPIAGRGRTQKILPKLKTYLDNSSAYSEIFITDKKGRAHEYVSNTTDNFNIIVSVGGDGTLNEIINGLNGNSHIKLGILPYGSGNDFAKALGIKNNFENNIHTIINSTNVFTVDVGKIEYKEFHNDQIIASHFINSCGIGFDALVSQLILKNHFLKGLPLYLSAVLKALFCFKPFEIDAAFDDKRITGKKLLVAIGNGKTSGGGFKLNPYAKLNDEKLDACIIDSLSKLKILQKLSKAITGKHNLLKEVKLLQFQKCTIHLSDPSYLHCDGEVISSSVSKVQIELRKDKLRFII
ncbi:MAG: diacylglycerol kinase family lipid kinase [Ignavibacteriales bacterium]|nr:diacylglycerol kinase family lipid kinase [Ignavibacteriales bacterium]